MISEGANIIVQCMVIRNVINPILIKDAGLLHVVA
jgi:hypothetical protein